MRILIPSDNRDFVAELVDAYRQAGCDVVTGANNFDFGAADFDLIHYQWPEEFCNWVPPSEARLEQILTRMRWWQERCTCIVTAHNLFAHGFDGDDACGRLFDGFYRACTWTLHFSKVSKDLICREYPGARHERHIVSKPWNFDRTLKQQKARGSCREAFGFAANDFVVLVFGAIRSWQEIELIQAAFKACSAPNKKLLIAGRYGEYVRPMTKRFREARWKFWLWRNGAAVEDRYIAEEDLYRYFDSSDVVVVPRMQRELNSGVPSLAMTFGAVLVAPSHGAFPEQLAGSGNLIYESGNIQSLARALEKAAMLDRKKIGLENRQIADQWKWSNIVGDCLNAACITPAGC